MHDIDEQELDVDMEPRAAGPLAGFLHSESEEPPQIESPSSVTSAMSAIPTCASDQHSLVKLGLLAVALLESPLDLKTLFD